MNKHLNELLNSTTTESGNAKYLKEFRSRQQLKITELLKLFTEEFNNNWTGDKDLVYLVCVQAIQRQRQYYSKLSIKELNDSIETMQMRLGHAIEIKLK